MGLTQGTDTGDTWRIRTKTAKYGYRYGTARAAAELTSGRGSDPQRLVLATFLGTQSARRAPDVAGATAQWPALGAVRALLSTAKRSRAQGSGAPVASAAQSHGRWQSRRPLPSRTGPHALTITGPGLGLSPCAARLCAALAASAPPLSPIGRAWPHARLRPTTTNAGTLSSSRPRLPPSWQHAPPSPSTWRGQRVYYRCLTEQSNLTLHSVSWTSRLSVCVCSVRHAVVMHKLELHNQQP